MQNYAPLFDTETWVFDLDNTLYSVSSNLWSQIDERMKGFIAKFLDLPEDQAYRVQKDYFRRHGTTLRGLMMRHDIDPHVFMDFVHDIDLSSVGPDVALSEALKDLPGRKLVFTNSDLRHAERILEHLGITQHFDAVFDIEDCGFIPKPEPQVYEALLKRHAIMASTSVMVEDMARNLIPAHDLGMATVWLKNDTTWGAQDSDGPHIHHAVDDLAPWLKSLTQSQTRD